MKEIDSVVLVAEAAMPDRRIPGSALRRAAALNVEESAFLPDGHSEVEVR
jgi:hypothetical protein